MTLKWRWNGNNFFQKSYFFRDFKPRRSRPSETALRLRSFPRGGPPLGEKNFKKIKINYFFLRNLSFLSFLPLCFLSNFLTFHKKIIYIFKKVRKFSKKFKTFRKFSKIWKKKLQKKKIKKWWKTCLIFFYQISTVPQDTMSLAHYAVRSWNDSMTRKLFTIMFLVFVIISEKL